MRPVRVGTSHINTMRCVQPVRARVTRCVRCMAYGWRAICQVVGAVEGLLPFW